MPVVVLLVVLVVIGFLLYKSVQDARHHPGPATTRPAAVPDPPRSRPRARSRPRGKARQGKAKVDEAALQAHVLKLREAVDGGFISIDEAVGSVVRQTDGALGEDAARKLLEKKTDDAA